MTTNNNNRIPELRFPGFEGEWVIKQIEEIFKITRGQVLPMKSVSPTKDENNPYAVYSSQTLNNGLAGFYKDFLYENAITWTTDGANAGEVRFRAGKFYCTNVCGVLLSNEGYANECIAAILNSVTKSHVSYVGNPKLMNNVMAKISILLPPTLAEQQKIADCLSSLDEEIAAEAQKADALKDHKKGLLQQLFPAMSNEQLAMSNEQLAMSNCVPKLRFPGFEGEWVVKKLGEIAELSKGKGIAKSDIDIHGQTQCIRYGELYTHYGEQIKTVFSRTNIPLQDLVLSEINDVIIPSSGETHEDIATASCILVPDVAIGGDINILRTPLNGLFLSYYLNSAKKHEIAHIAQGDAVVHLYGAQLSELSICFPPTLAEQQKIADCLSELDEMISAQQQKVEVLKEHKKGLMQKLFPKISNEQLAMSN